ncbi:type IIL restriction-modification enzyme MmeI [[Phormidium] sp. ETS-05]|uniref:type IIL restriction-modification enzyme MmeI n=1 Tax=[Phormidium] sp. ETS-05 TaxID=222819 RepID=UPI0031FEF6D0
MRGRYPISARALFSRHYCGYVRPRTDGQGISLVREAHDRNDEIIDRIYIGRRFKNDTERLEKLFDMYTKMTSQQKPEKKSAQRKKAKE